MKCHLVVNYYLVNVISKFHEDPCINARARVIKAHTRFIASVRVYNSCARIFARIFMKFKILALKIVFDHHMKFHKDPSFHCGDICKTILTLGKLLFSRYFPYFPIFAPKKSSKMNNYWMIIGVFGN